MHDLFKQLRKLKNKDAKLLSKLWKEEDDLQQSDIDKKAEESKKPKVKKDLMPPGSRLDIKTVYSGPEDDQGRFDWKEKPPKNLGKPVEDEESSEFAFIVRRIKVYNDPRKLLELHSLVIQSPHLRKLLEISLAKYPGVATSLDRLEFEKPFEPLVHRWTALKDAVAAETNDEAKKHADLFINLLETELSETMSTSVDLKTNKVMTYGLLWTLCEPGDLVFSKQNGQEVILKLLSTQYGSFRGAPVFWLSCQQIDWDGAQWGTTRQNLMVRKYSGIQAIRSLSAFPLQYHPKESEVRQRVAERGVMMQKLAGTHYKSYNGIGWREAQCGIQRFNITGRVVIDTSSWNRHNPNHNVRVKKVVEESESNEEEDYDDYDDVPDDGKLPDEKEIDESNRREVTDDQRLCIVPTLRGYALREKEWVNLYPTCVNEVEFSTAAFESLVLPANQKELVLGFTQSQQQAGDDNFDDVIKGKGRGMGLLLCGAPGVGKTLTAESVAEELHAPLYMMSAAELGLEPRHVETKLTSILEMCQRWKAVLLIDEADIFLEERSLHELERNKLVSVFLRVLEYYEGILFLTTNRVNTIDDAFQSRIHISLEYPALNAESRMTVWKSFLGMQKRLTNGDAKEESKMVTEHDISMKQLEKLAQEVALNGRQIKVRLFPPHLAGAVLTCCCRTLSKRLACWQSAAKSLSRTSTSRQYWT